MAGVPKRVSARARRDARGRRLGVACCVCVCMCSTIKHNKTLIQIKYVQDGEHFYIRVFSILHSRARLRARGRALKCRHHRLVASVTLSRSLAMCVCLHFWSACLRSRTHREMLNLQPPRRPTTGTSPPHSEPAEPTQKKTPTHTPPDARRRWSVCSFRAFFRHFTRVNTAY